MLDAHIPTLIFIKWLIDGFTGLDPQVQSGWIASLTAALSTVITVGLTQRYASKNLKETLNVERVKHEAQLAEQRADRLFDARREVASKCLGAIQHYKAQTDDNKKFEALEQLEAALIQNGGELTVLFSGELSKIVQEINKRILVILFSNNYGSFDEIELENLSKVSKPSRNERNQISNLNHLVRENKSKIEEDMVQLTEQFSLFAEAISKELGTYQEPPTKKKNT